MFALAPIVGHDVVDVGHPAAAVITESPGTLEARPPRALAFDLDGAWGIEAAFLEQADHHGAGPY